MKGDKDSVPTSNRTRKAGSFQLAWQTQNDLLDVWVFIAEDSRDATARFVMDVDKTYKLIKTAPNFGSPERLVEEPQGKRKCRINIAPRSRYLLKTLDNYVAICHI